jgi:hypothetical protein
VHKEIHGDDLRETKYDKFGKRDVKKTKKVTFDQEKLKTYYE